MNDYNTFMTNERGLTPEAEATLCEAVKKISDLYSGEVMQDGLVSVGALQKVDPLRDALWRESANLFPTFKNKVLGLKITLNNARLTDENTGGILRNVVENHFQEVGDLAFRHLLTTILSSRATIAQGAVDRMFVLEHEKESMKKELGIIPGIPGLSLETMSLRRGIEAVLTGELQFSRQTQTHENL